MGFYTSDFCDILASHYSSVDFLFVLVTVFQNSQEEKKNLVNLHHRKQEQ